MDLKDYLKECAKALDVPSKVLIKYMDDIASPDITPEKADEILQRIPEKHRVKLTVYTNTLTLINLFKPLEQIRNTHPEALLLDVETATITDKMAVVFSSLSGFLELIPETDSTKAMSIYLLIFMFIKAEWLTVLSGMKMYRCLCELLDIDMSTIQSMSSSTCKVYNDFTTDLIGKILKDQMDVPTEQLH